MVPVELVFFVIVIIFGVIGIVRGYLKELGVTTVMVVMLFGVTTFESRLSPILTKAATKVAPNEVASIQAAFWIAAVAFAAFISYQGQTLAFEGTQPKGALATALNLMSGLVNGYLIAGSIWYYLHRLGYPVLGIKPENLSSLAQAMVPLLPPRLLAPYLIYLVLFLVIMRVVK